MTSLTDIDLAKGPELAGQAVGSEHRRAAWVVRNNRGDTAEMALADVPGVAGARAA